ncbi:MAG TPA: VTT domain-containing protein [Candidatus Saccharimonadales bacterium]|nr:VTT domain-containing protein [Candidatus Saccharimonadales bacterium]
MFIGTFLEEVFSPIPSFIVLVPAGAVAQAQGQSLIYLMLLNVISCVARVIGGLLIYYLADKLEDIIFAKGRSFWGVTHKQMEQAGEQLKQKKGSQVWLALFAMHAVPVFPSAMLSLAAGFIKVDLKTFVTSLFLGSIVSTPFYLGIGYFGLQSAALFDSLEKLTYIIAALCVIAIALFAWKTTYNRKKRNKK